MPASLVIGNCSRSKIWCSCVSLRIFPKQKLCHLNLLTYGKGGMGEVAEWLCSGLQSRGRRFDSDLRLHSKVVKNIKIWRGGRVLMQRCAKPFRPVKIRAPASKKYVFARVVE